MSIALVLDNADFSANALKIISFDDYVWSDIEIPSSVIHENVGFMWGDSGASESQKGTVVPQSYSPSWGNVFTYTDAIVVPVGAKYIRGSTNALSISFTSGRTYNKYPFVNFYDNSNNFVEALDSDDFNSITLEVQPTGGSVLVHGYKGSFYVEVPQNAKKYRLQWVKNGWQANTGDISAIEISLPALQFGFEP